jgi:hypothetical protein
MEFSTMPPNQLTERPTLPDLFPSSVAEAGVKRVEDVMGLQKQLVTYLQDVSRNWFDHMQSEAVMASELSGRLAGARSMPDVVTAWQEWTNRRMELLAQDSRQVLKGTEKLLEAGARAFADGWPVGKSEASKSKNC